MIKSGDLRHRVDIKVLSQSQNTTTGNLSPSWSTLKSLWASIKPLSGREIIAAQSIESKINSKIIVRYDDEIRAGMQVAHGTRNFKIEAVTQDGDSGLEYLVLYVSEVI